MAKTIEQQIEKLARMTQRGFKDMQKRFDWKISSEVTSLRKEMATKIELRETEGRLLNAIRGVEVKRQDFDSLEGDVKELDRRVATLEKQR